MQKPLGQIKILFLIHVKCIFPINLFVEMDEAGNGLPLRSTVYKEFPHIDECLPFRDLHLLKEMT